MARRNQNKKNPRNPENPLFRQLTKLLSGPLVKYRRQDTKQLKRRQLDKYKSRFRSASGQEFKLAASQDVYGQLQPEYYSNQNRMDRYVDFDQMEFTPEIASALDIYADEMTTCSLYTPLLNIICSNIEIKSVLETLFYNILNIEFNLYGWSRSMCKYGDFFLYLDIEEDEGIKNVIGLPPNEIERLEGEDKANPNYIQFQWNSAAMTLENWQMAHFRILGNDKFAPYGTSALDAARRIWRQLTLLEDAMMAYRIVRSPDRRVFYIDVGNIPPQDVEQYMQRVMTQMKRNQIVDVNSGRVDLRYNPLSIEEDYYIPIRGQASQTKIEPLSGGKYTGDIEDVKYLRDKLFSALKIPASYLARAEGSEEDKATLAQKDVRFARTIQRLQRSIVSELEKVAIIHLFTMGYRGNDLLSFKLALNNPSKIAELQELEHWKARFEAADAASEGYFSRRWVAKNILNVSEQEFQRMQFEMFYDRKHDFSLEQVAEAAGGPGGAGGALGGLEGLDDKGAPDAPAEGPEIPGEEPGAEPGSPAPGDEEGAGPLLAAAGAPPEPPPGNRDDKRYPYSKRDKFGRKQTTTDRSHGWYEPVDVDRRKSSGPRRRSLLGLTGAELASSTERNTLKGYSDLKSLYKLSENLDSNYHEDEEAKLFKENHEIKVLIDSLEKNSNEI